MEISNTLSCTMYAALVMCAQRAVIQLVTYTNGKNAVKKNSDRQCSCCLYLAGRGRDFSSLFLVLCARPSCYIISPSSPFLPTPLLPSSFTTTTTCHFPLQSPSSTSSTSFLCRLRRLYSLSEYHAHLFHVKPLLTGDIFLLLPHFIVTSITHHDKASIQSLPIQERHGIHANRHLRPASDMISWCRPPRISTDVSRAPTHNPPSFEVIYCPGST